MIGRFRAIAAIVTLAASPLIGVIGTATPASAAPVGTISNIPLISVVDPEGITTGADGNVWYTSTTDDSIGRLTPGGVLTEFDTPGYTPRPGVTSGPDGALWFGTDDGIGRRTLAGALTLFDDPDVNVTDGITAGPDGNIWFTNTSISGGTTNDSIGRISPAGDITFFDDPSVINPRTITLGPDGALWFANGGDDDIFDPTNDSIGRIATDGTITSFADPAMRYTRAITAGPDGALWFGGYRSIGRITTSGDLTWFPTGIDVINAITLGGDGRLWFGAGIVGAMATDGTIQLVSNNNKVSGPQALTLGADGNVWFADLYRDAIGRVTPAGTRTDFKGAGAAGPSGIVRGPDGNLWFTSSGAVAGRGNLLEPGVSRLTPGGAATTFPLPSTMRVPGPITNGPGGRLYFAATGGAFPIGGSQGWVGSAIGRVTTAGAVYPVRTTYGPTGIAVGPDNRLWYPTSRAFIQFGLEAPPTIERADGLGTNVASTQLADAATGEIVRGPDGNMWFAAGARIGRITTSGAVTTFPIPGGVRTAAITVGPDGALWFTDVGTSAIGRITTSGAATLYDHATISEPRGITTGADGNLWFTNFGNDSIGRITTSGVVTNYTDASISNPIGITAGPDDALWFANSGNDSIGRVQVLLADAVSMAYPTTGTPVNGGTLLAAGIAAGVDPAAVEFRATGGAFNDAVVASASSTPFGWYGGWATAAVPEGSYSVVAVVTDTAGNRGRSAPITIIVDHTPPTTQMLLPAPGATVAGVTLLDAAASDNVGATKVEFRATGGALSNTVIGTGTLTYFGWIATWDTTAVANGTYSVRSRAYDAAANNATSAPITIKVQN